jgi:hypothetical protein
MSSPTRRIDPSATVSVLQNSHSERRERTFVLLHQGLLVMVSPEAGNSTNFPRLLPRVASVGRLRVDLHADPAVEAWPA